MRNIVLLFIIYVCAVLQAYGALPLDFPSAGGASVGIRIVRISDGKAIADYDSERLLVPASVQKCLTAATAQLSLPSDFRFVTRLAAYGALSPDGVLNGSLAVVGGYDPTLGSRFFDKHEAFDIWASRQLGKYGVKCVKGDVFAMPSDIPSDALSPYWLLEDLEWEYGAGCYPINYRDNSFDSKEGRMADSDPAAVLCDVVVERLAKDGIAMEMDTDMDYSETLSAGELSPGKVWSYFSPDRDDILKVMMHRSDNLYAEAMLRALLLPACDGHDMEVAIVGTDSAVVVQRDVWKDRGIDLSRGRIVDGSGLAPVNRMSARMLSDVLQSMARKRSYSRLFPIAGRDGTVRNFLRRTPLEGRMALKSGSMTGVMCYAGYMLDVDGTPTHTVVVMVNNFTCTSAKVRSAISSYLNKMFPHR
ncbi:D-alanyl-D-alanine carboxypeptidase/D-alanyl-D-alanine-endopeptidase [Muribaculum sp.]|uniref:D-alanyl-D-alanine carboxypeptidase/D-alanyl-D-alanine-endopeptidase n=1 Tax=Muribaculum sp. TaxID=1918611 RepID=UPI0023C6DB04|nr:D-alanyl-D-alanine carboxypeptidase [Muribaculum sp.]MDE5704687.1 D-alanyl-D-alanine carboxypeptidase [Muribaculum sp.]